MVTRGRGEATGGGVAVGLALYLLRIHISAIPCHYETPLPVAVTRIPFGLWHFLSRVQCVLILWVLPFLLLAASRRHSRSTSALSTADSVGQSGEQALTA